MAINIDTQDIVQYPGTVKRVTVDQTKIVPSGFEGDEQFAMTISTSAYSDNTLRTAISDIYILDLIVGWAKSSGLTGSAGKFALDATHNTLRIKMDATVSGSDGSGYYPITLAYNAGGTPKLGEDIAADMEEKIRAITCVSADTGYQLAYTNCTVEYAGSKFWIVSGSFAESFTDAYRSSVAVASGTTNDCTGILGLSDPVTSEEIANREITESLLSSDYTADSATLSVSTGHGATAGDACMITDGTNTEYFTVLSVSTNDLTVPTSGTNGYVGITNNYATADYARIQVLREQDPDVMPQSYVSSVDETVKFGLKNIINQIDYSS